MVIDRLSKVLAGETITPAASTQTPAQTQTQTPATGGKTVTVESALEIIGQIQSQYLQGTSFVSGYTSTMRNANGGGTSSDVGIAVWAYKNTTGKNNTSITGGCGGWAAFVSDSIFGTTGYPARKTTMANARPGDIIIHLNPNGLLNHVAVVRAPAYTIDGITCVDTTDANPVSGKYQTEWDMTLYGTTNGYDTYEVWTRYPD